MSLAKLHDVLRGKSIAIVGSSPNLGKHGEAIDAHDLVLRFNLASPINREEALGTRTDIVACNCHVSSRLPNRSLSLYIKKKYITKNAATALLEHLKLQDPVYLCRANGISKKPNIINISQSGSRNFCNKILKNVGIKLQLRKEPRLGFHVICLLIKLGIKPSVFYFDIAKPSQAKYYCSDKKSPYHDIVTEGKALMQISAKGLIVSKCDS